jgi:hypothetical protein
MGRPVTIVVVCSGGRAATPTHLKTVAPRCITETAAGSKNPRTSAGLVRVPASPLRDANQIKHLNRDFPGVSNAISNIAIGRAPTARRPVPRRPAGWSWPIILDWAWRRQVQSRASARGPRPPAGHLPLARFSQSPAKHSPPPFGLSGMPGSGGPSQPGWKGAGVESNDWSWPGAERQLWSERG